MLRVVRPIVRLQQLTARNLHAKAIVYSDYGDPKEQLKIWEHEVADEPANNEVLVKLVACPINPADLNQVEGVYPSKPEMSEILGSSKPIAVGGNEGVFEVIKSGAAAAAGFQPGDWVLPRVLNLGTWRTAGMFQSTQLYKIANKNGLNPVQAAIVSVNPTTAHQMLSKFVTLDKGDWWIQNGATSGVGRAAMQLSRAWGLNSINIVRDRDSPEEFAQLEKELKALGATHVLTESQMADRKTLKPLLKEWTQGKPVRLALNCVGGKSATNMARQLGHSGEIVTYGGMSKQPLTFPTSLFIFKNLVARGYWLSEWTKQDPDSKMEVVQQLLDMYRSGELQNAPVTEHKIGHDMTDEVIAQVLSTRGKSVLVM